MPYTESRKARERRLRAKYRKKTAITSIITLLIGLVLGFVLCVLSVNHPGTMSNLLKIGPIKGSASQVADEESAPAEEAPADEQGLFGEESAPAEEPDEDAVLTFNNADGEPADAADLGGEDEALFGEEEDIDGEVAFGTEEAPVESEDVEPEGEEVEPEGDEPAMISAEGDAPEITAAEVTEAPTLEPTEAPTEAPTNTPEPTATPEPTPTPAPEPVIVPYGQACTLQTEILADGTERSEASDAPFETLSLTLKVDAYKNPAYFQEQYATQYKLQGDEAAVQFDITLNNYTGTAEIIPQNFLLITFVGETPDIAPQGYQLMDAEIGGKTDIAIASDVTSTLYKRYSYSAEQGDMVYMVVTAYVDGAPQVYWFEILEPEPVETPAPEESEESGDGATEADSDSDAAETASGEALTIGSQGPEVERLQRVLIDKGLLQGSPDGKFGNYTAEAVRIMQERFGMEPTGVADQTFLARLYSES